MTPKPKQTRRKNSPDQQTFLEHLYELRGRIAKVALVLVLGSLLGYAFQDQIVHFLLAPLSGEKLVYLTPGGGFDFIFKVSLYVGCAVTIPFAIYQAYRYLAPIMKRKQSRRMTAVVVALSLVLAISGMLFGYYVALPAALSFLTNFAGDYIEASLTASSYLNFVTAYSLGLAALFQLPIILIFINAINGPIDPSKLLSSEKYVLAGSFILAAMITPTPDVVNQTIVAAPVMAVYQIGVVMVIIQNMSAKVATKNNEESDSNATGIEVFAKENQQVGAGYGVTAVRPVAMSQNIAMTNVSAGRVVDGVALSALRARSAGVPRPPQRPVSAVSRVYPSQRMRTVNIDGIISARQSVDM